MSDQKIRNAIRTIETSLREGGLFRYELKTSENTLILNPKRTTIKFPYPIDPTLWGDMYGDRKLSVVVVSDQNQKLQFTINHDEYKKFRVFDDSPHDGGWRNIGKWENYRTLKTDDINEVIAMANLSLSEFQFSKPVRGLKPALWAGGTVLALVFLAKSCSAEGAELPTHEAQHDNNQKIELVLGEP